MKRLLFLVLLPAVVALALAWSLVVPRGPVSVHLSGDGAGALSEELRLPTGLVRTNDPDAARLQVITLAEWFNLQYIPEAAALCGAPCQAEDAPDLVRILSLSPAGSTKTVLLNARFLTNLRADDGPDPAAIRCLARIVESELVTLGAGEPPACAAGMKSLTRRALPFGLAYF